VIYASASILYTDMFVTPMFDIVCITLQSGQLKHYILNTQCKKYVKRVAAGNYQRDKWMIGN